MSFVPDWVVLFPEGGVFVLGKILKVPPIFRICSSKRRMPTVRPWDRYVLRYRFARLGTPLVPGYNHMTAVEWWTACLRQ